MVMPLLLFLLLLLLFVSMMLIMMRTGARGVKMLMRRKGLFCYYGCRCFSVLIKKIVYV